MDKLQRCKFQMHWLNKQVSATGSDDNHEAFLAEVSRGKSIENIFMYLRKHDEKQVLRSVDPKSKRSPLHIACKHGYMHLIELFLNKGADVEARDKLLKTPLHYACENGHALVVKTLMENRADPFEKDNCGRTALHYAIYSGQTDVLAILTMSNEGIVHIKDHAGRTPLHHAVFMESNQILLISKLISHGADVNAVDNDRRTPLHHAAEAGKPRVIPILVQNSALTAVKDKFGKTPLELAANNHIKELIIAYCAPQYQPSEEKIMESLGKKDMKVNKKGQMQFPVTYDPPLETINRETGTLKKKKKVV